MWAWLVDHGKIERTLDENWRTDSNPALPSLVVSLAEPISRHSVTTEWGQAWSEVPIQSEDQVFDLADLPEATPDSKVLAYGSVAILLSDDSVIAAADFARKRLAKGVGVVTSMFDLHTSDGMTAPEAKSSLPEPLAIIHRSNGDEQWVYVQKKKRGYVSLGVRLPKEGTISYSVSGSL